MSIPYVCVGCEKTSREVEDCRIRLVRFTVFGMKCPREKPIEAIPPREEPKPAGFEPTALKEPVVVKPHEVLTTNIRLEDLELGVFSPRKVFSQHYIDELAESIEREGQLKPIVARPHPEKPETYQLLDGEHRVRALKKLGRYTARVEARILSDEEADLLAMRINQMHGKRLNELEEGLHVKKLMEKHRLTQTDIGAKLKRSQQWISQRLKLVRDASDQLLDAFTTRVVNLSKAREIAELPKEDQPALVERVVKEKLSFKDTETLVHVVKDRPASKAEILAKPINELTPPPKDIREFEEEHGPEKPKFETGRCPHCGAEFIVNWPLCRINWRE